MFLNSVTSELVTPGPRITSFGELPASPRAGREKAAVLNHCVRLRPPDGRFGPPVPSGRRLPAATPVARARSPPPVMSAPSDAVHVTFTGTPLASVVRPENCQLSSTARAKRLFQRALARGMSHV